MLQILQVIVAFKTVDSSYYSIRREAIPCESFVATKGKAIKSAASEIDKAYVKCWLSEDKKGIIYLSQEGQFFCTTLDGKPRQVTLPKFEMPPRPDDTDLFGVRFMNWVDYNPSAHVLAYAKDKSVVVKNGLTGKTVVVPTKLEPHHLLISPNGRQIAYSLTDGGVYIPGKDHVLERLRVVDLATGKITFTTLGCPMDWTPSGKLLVLEGWMTYGHDLKEVNLKTRKSKGLAFGGGSDMTVAKYDPDGKISVVIVDSIEDNSHGRLRIIRMPDLNKYHLTSLLRVP